MKKKLLTIALSCLTYTGFAAEPFQEKTFLTFRAGLSTPRGNFGSKSVYNPKAGFADNGFHIAGEYGGFFNNYIGLGGTFGIRRNSIDLSEVNKYSGINPIYASTSYRCNYLLANLIFKFPLAPDFYLYLKGGGGVTFNTYPELYSSTSTNSQPEQKITGDALAYGLGGGFKYLINKIGIGLEAYSLYTTPSFQFYSTLAKQDMHSVNYSLNLSFNFK